MTLNATLIVQIVNFFIAWGTVRYIFMRPALKVRDEVYGELKLLSAERDTLHEAVRSVADQEYRAWHMWYMQAHKIMKDRYQIQRYQEPIAMRVPTPEIPPYELEKVTEQLTRLVSKRLQESS